MVSLGLLTASSLAAAEDPSLGLPRPGDASWWSTAAVLALQALVLVWTSAVPALVLAVLAAAPLALSVAEPNGAVSLTMLAVVVGLYLTVSERQVPRPRLLVPVGFSWWRSRSSATKFGSAPSEPRRPSAGRCCRV
ncbi:hypothetical protein AB0C38_13485 [Amycolatopsis sp. NPDC048633]|uniref:hypothetical protein n=1 Tax=Amycolatopsis sp. NPDC048633 TaxID=3157095 RepID=UPI0033D4FA09